MQYTVMLLIFFYFHFYFKIRKECSFNVLMLRIKFVCSCMVRSLPFFSHSFFIWLVHSIHFMYNAYSVAFLNFVKFPSWESLVSRLPCKSKLLSSFFPSSFYVICWCFSACLYEYAWLNSIFLILYNSYLKREKNKYN